MYKSNIANELNDSIKAKIDSMIKKTGLINFNEQVKKSRNKDELRILKQKILEYRELQQNQVNEKNHSKVYSLENAGFIDIIMISGFLGVSLGIIIGICFLVLRG